MPEEALLRVFRELWALTQPLSTMVGLTVYTAKLRIKALTPLPEI